MSLIITLVLILFIAFLVKKGAAYLFDNEEVGTWAFIAALFIQFGIHTINKIL